MIVIAAICLFLVFNPSIVGQAVNASPSSGGKGTGIIIDKNNFNLYLQQQQIVKDLPKDAAISFVIDEVSYSLNKGVVVKGKASNPDLEITLPSKYVPMMGDFCNAVKTANKNRDLGVKLNIGRAAFLWKYRGVLKYKSCLGF